MQSQTPVRTSSRPVDSRPERSEFIREKPRETQHEFLVSWATAAPPLRPQSRNTRRHTNLILIHVPPLTTASSDTCTRGQAMKYGSHPKYVTWKRATVVPLYPYLSFQNKTQVANSHGKACCRSGVLLASSPVLIDSGLKFHVVMFVCLFFVHRNARKHFSMMYTPFAGYVTSLIVLQHTTKRRAIRRPGSTLQQLLRLRSEHTHSSKQLRGLVILSGGV